MGKSKGYKNRVTLEIFAYETGLFPDDPITTVAYHQWVRDGGTLWEWWADHQGEFV